MKRTFWQRITGSPGKTPILDLPKIEDLPFREYPNRFRPNHIEFDPSVDGSRYCCDDCGGLDKNLLWCKAFARFLPDEQEKCAACVAMFDTPGVSIGVRVSGPGGTRHFADWFDEEKRKAATNG